MKYDALKASLPRVFPRGVLAALVLSVLATAGASAAERCELRVAWDPYEPYSYSIGDDSAPVGFDIDVVTKVGDMIGCSLSFEKMPWSDILAALREGRVDVTVGTGYKPGRAAWSWYSESYRKEVVGLLIRAGTAARFAGGDLNEVFAKGLIFGRTTDDSYASDVMQVLDRYPDQVLEPVSEQENIERLLGGAIDGFLIEVHVASALMGHAGVTERLQFHPLTFEAGDYRLQMSRKTVPKELLVRIDAAIQQLRFDGWLTRTSRKYGGGESRAQ